LQNNDENQTEFLKLLTVTAPQGNIKIQRVISKYSRCR